MIQNLDDRDRLFWDFTAATVDPGGSEKKNYSNYSTPPPFANYFGAAFNLLTKLRTILKFNSHKVNIPYSEWYSQLSLRIKYSQKVISPNAKKYEIYVRNLPFGLHVRKQKPKSHMYLSYFWFGNWILLYSFSFWEFILRIRLRIKNYIEN